MNMTDRQFALLALAGAIAYDLFDSTQLFWRNGLDQDTDAKACIQAVEKAARDLAARCGQEDAYTCDLRDIGGRKGILETAQVTPEDAKRLIASNLVPPGIIRYRLLDMIEK